MEILIAGAIICKLFLNTFITVFDHGRGRGRR